MLIERCGRSPTEPPAGATLACGAGAVGDRPELQTGAVAGLLTEPPAGCDFGLRRGRGEDRPELQTGAVAGLLTEPPAGCDFDLWRGHGQKLVLSVAKEPARAAYCGGLPAPVML